MLLANGAQSDTAGWSRINFTARSLVAAGCLSFCVLLTALSATASVRDSETTRLAENRLAEEVSLLADLVAYLAAETASTREAFGAPRMKPAARPARGVAIGEGVIADFVDFDFTQVTIAKLDAEERRCLAQAIYYEARSESRIGQLAVADVVLNRVASPIYPNSICEVVYQGSERRTGCQFSFTCDGSMQARLNKTKWKESEDLAGAILAGLRVPVSRNATHYHANYVSPDWSQRLTPTATIGTHKFYRFPDRATVASAGAK